MKEVAPRPRRPCTYSDKEAANFSGLVEFLVKETRGQTDGRYPTTPYSDAVMDGGGGYSQVGKQPHAISPLLPRVRIY
jgi:hypothetical protein